MKRYKVRELLLGLSLCGVMVLPAAAFAEDCTGTLPGADCTLDENTTAVLTIDNAVTLTVGGSVTIGHTVDGSSDDVGTVMTNSGGITVSQTVAIGGTAPIDSLSIGDGDTWTTSADIITNADNGDANNGAVTGDIDLGTADGGEVLNLNGGLTIDGYIDGHAADTLNVGADSNGGTFSFDRPINTVILNVVSGTMVADSSLGSGTLLADIGIQSGAILTLGGASSNTATLNLDGTLSIESGNSLTVQNYTADANNGRLLIGLDRDTGAVSNGQLNFTGGGPADLSGMTLAVNIESGSEVLVTELLTNVIQGNGGATTLPTVEDSSFLYDFSLSQSGSNVDLQITRQDFATATTSANNQQVAQNLFVDLGQTNNPIVKTAQANLSNASSQEEFNELLESLAPGVDRSTVIAADLVTNKTIDLAQQRLAYLRTGHGKVAAIDSAGETGLSTGNAYSERGKTGGRVWGQVFGASARQSARDGIDGYDSGATGVSFGGDTGGIHDRVVIGSLVTYAKTEMDSDNANATHYDVNSYQIAGYATYEFDNDVYVNGTLTWGLNKIDSYRFNVGGTGLQAAAQYDSEQLGFHAEVGKDYRDEEVVVTPSFMARYTFLETEHYYETGAGGLNLDVYDDTVNSFRVGPRLDTRWEYQTDSGMYVIPEVNLGYSYDLVGDTAESVASYEVGGAQIPINGFSAQRHDFNVGFGGMLADDKWEMKVGYGFDINGDFSMHSGFIRGAYKF